MSYDMRNLSIPNPLDPTQQLDYEQATKLLKLHRPDLYQNGKDPLSIHGRNYEVDRKAVYERDRKRKMNKETTNSKVSCNSNNIYNTAINFQPITLNQLNFDINDIDLSTIPENILNPSGVVHKNLPEEEPKSVIEAMRIIEEYEKFRNTRSTQQPAIRKKSRHVKKKPILNYRSPKVLMVPNSDYLINTNLDLSYIRDSATLENNLKYLNRGEDEDFSNLAEPPKVSLARKFLNRQYRIAEYLQNIKQGSIQKSC